MKSKLPFIAAVASLLSLGGKIPQMFPSDTRTRRIMPRHAASSRFFPRWLGAQDAYGTQYKHTRAGIRRTSPRVVDVKRAARKQSRESAALALAS